MQFICIAEKYIYPDSNQFRDTPRIFVFDDAIFIINFMEHHSKQNYSLTLSVTGCEIIRNLQR